jgi:hypothetical protein
MRSLHIIQYGVRGPHQSEHLLLAAEYRCPFSPRNSGLHCQVRRWNGVPLAVAAQIVDALLQCVAEAASSLGTQLACPQSLMGAATSTSSPARRTELALCALLSICMLWPLHRHSICNSFVSIFEVQAPASDGTSPLLVSRTRLTCRNTRAVELHNVCKHGEPGRSHR